MLTQNRTTLRDLIRFDIFDDMGSVRLICRVPRTAIDSNVALNQASRPECEPTSGGLSVDLLEELACSIMLHCLDIHRDPAGE